MMHITEDTPPDMLAGAMDLAISLPDGRDVKMSVERSTPMMDLLVQVTTAYKLRPSDHIIQAINMSSGNHSDKILPYKPNTPIGALDTQNIRVLPKGRQLPLPKNISPGHQPFESTFRLQVHLPRNQFCVIRVGKQCMLEDIMKKVCEEKNLDPRKYECRHPGNVDKVLDPKRTLSDYEITEITVVQRGSSRLQQTISSGDIMALQREEERRKMQAKTGGGVLNLIFRRGRNSMGSGSVSSDTRSVSPTQSDDSRSVTPPAVQPPQLVPVVSQEPKPKPPQRKRRPAPKPPQNNTNQTKENESELNHSENHQQTETKLDNGLTICHSRNSSDSSGYHEASILSDNCNTTLPRRPKSNVINTSSGDSALGMDKTADLSKSTGNLSNMVSQSKSTTSLTNAGRKKKAPPPPPVLKAANSLASLPITTVAGTVATETITPVIHASNKPPIVEPKPEAVALVSRPFPPPRNKNLIPVPAPRKVAKPLNVVQESDTEDSRSNIDTQQINTTDNISLSSFSDNTNESVGQIKKFHIGKSLQSVIDDQSNNDITDNDVSSCELNSYSSFSSDKTIENDLEIDDIDLFDYKNNQKIQREDIQLKNIIPPENSLDKKDFKGSIESLTSLRSMDSIPTFLGNGSIKKWNNYQNLNGLPVDSSMHNTKWDDGESDADSPGQTSNTMSSRTSCSSLQSSNLTVTEKEISPEKIYNDTSPVENNKNFLNKESLPFVSTNDSTIVSNEENDTTSKIVEDTIKKDSTSLTIDKVSPPTLVSEDINELEAEWQYQLPSPPKAFRDSSPTNFTDLTNYDTVTFNGLPTESVATPTPALEKDIVKDNISEGETISEIDDTDSQILTSKYLSVETLEKRKSLVLERELSSLQDNKKTNDNSGKSYKNSKTNLINEVEEVIQNRTKSSTLSRTNSQIKDNIVHSATDSTLPNFKITTYDQQPKSKINIFEDDSIRSNDHRLDINKRNSLADINVCLKNTKIHENNNEETFLTKKRNSLGNSSTENMNFMKKMNSLDEDVFKKPKEVTKYSKFNSLAKKPSLQNGESNVTRSESFSQQNGWIKSNPVKRSKSQISLEKYKDDTKISTENDDLPKSNSMWNVSGLQSLEVMRMILPKLGNSPPTSPVDEKPLEPAKPDIDTHDNLTLKPPELESKPKMPETSKPAKIETPKPAKPEKPETLKPIVQEAPKVYQYRGPPSINLSTWSERPKSQIAIKEDKDYKISSVGAAKSKFSSQTNLNSNTEIVKPNPDNVGSVNIRINSVENTDQTDSGKINIKINSEPNKTIINQTPGNVVIKIGNTTNNEEVSNKTESKNSYSRFLNQTTAVGYRKPLGNINGVDKPRPRSIAFDSSCPDISRVPIVRSVELKKPFKETHNKSITQITHSDDSNHIYVRNGEGPRSFDIPDYKPDVKSSTLGNRYSSVYVSSENINSNNKTQNFYSKPVSRVSSFAFTRPTNNNNNAPVVKGFRAQQKTENIIENNNVTNWNHNHYGTLPAKPSITQINNSSFSQNHLKRTNHSNQFDKFSNNTNTSTPIEKVILRSTSNGGTALPNRNSTGSVFNTVGLANGNKSTIPPPPVPPQLPKVTSVTKKNMRQIEPKVDARDQLLNAIRNFGGKSGLKPIKNV